ncbi:hypothetical protein EEL42_01465 [Muribaculaceae bacterium Isolate-100 (HZI)]|nr:hypothetical protein EEL42_01465 [Muribaculaceae bacterium Isolate-100 (HZI)]
MIIFKNLRDLLLMTVICLVALQSCCGCEDYISYGTLWTIKNNSAITLLHFNVDTAPDGTLQVAKGYDQDGDYGICTSYMCRHEPGGVYNVHGQHLGREDEIKYHKGLRIYFVELPETEYNFFFTPAAEALFPYYLAYREVTQEWMEAHYWHINFPDDCTVNPDLWKIYDLDAFVEKYGPLNAKGWDEVWQKWEENKRTGEVETEMAEFPPLYCE